MLNKNQIEKKINEYESLMQDPNFWSDKLKAQEIISTIAELKSSLGEESKYDNGDALINIFAGAGGDDAEDFVRILFGMYRSYAENKNYTFHVLNTSFNTLGGYRNVSFEVKGKGAYKKLSFESGVHRLVRKSPFNKKGKRQTSFALVEVLPNIPQQDFTLDESELDISFTRSGGAGGQNVNKRETAVRITHFKTGLSVFISEERTQERNRERALTIIRAKLYKKYQEDEEKKSKGLSISDKISIEWGNQIRSYIMDPYHLVKDHIHSIETKNIEEVLRGSIDIFQVEKNSKNNC